MPLTHTRHLRTIARIVRPFGIVLLLLLVVFQFLPLIGGIDADTINAAGIQRTRAEVLAKDALILEYRPVDMHPQAISDIQTTLPLFEQEQAALSTDARPDVQIIATQEKPDYLAIDAAAHVILAKPDGPVDPIQVAIILMHDRQYVIAANSVVLILQQSAERRVWWLFGIQACIDGCVIAIGIVFGIYEDRAFTGVIHSLETQKKEMEA